MIRLNTLSMETKVCPNCGVEFYRKPSEMKRCTFCSVSCRMQSVRKQRQTECKVCKKVFYPEKRANRKSAQFCSQKCMGESYAVLDYNMSFLDETIEFIDGFLLGDGHVTKQNSHVSWSLKHQEFSDYIKANLKLYDPKDSRRYQKDTRCKQGGYHITRGNTKCHPDFVSQRQRWYKDKKIIPKDIVISPTSLMIWYLGDGVCSDYGVTLCTDNFYESDVNFLVRKLNRIGIICKKRNTQGRPRIAITSTGRKVFFDYIGWKSPVKCYDYKFPDHHRDRGYSTTDRNMSTPE